MSSLTQQPTIDLYQGAAGQAGRVQVVPLANAAATVAVVGYLGCVALSILAPDVLLWFAQTWVHTLALEPVRPVIAWFQPGPVVVGLITFGGAVWLGTAAIAWLYNWLARS